MDSIVINIIRKIKIMEREEVEYSHHFTHDSIDEYIYIAYFKRYLTILTPLIKS
jgi:hypothetical protein